MTSIPHVAATLHAILITTADLAGRQTGFVQRTSPITGSVFVQTLVFGLLANPQASLSELTQTAAALGITITAQALDQRFTETASLCLEQVLTAALRTVVTTDPVAIAFLARFNGVYLQDSTTIVLPPAFDECWTGCGGSTPEGDAALKLQVQLNLSDGQLLGQLKLWKSQGAVDVVREVNYWRQTCELYAKLLARLVEHWVLVMSCWKNVDRSLTKAATTLRQHAGGLAEVLRVPVRLKEKLETIARCIAAGCPINRRRKGPNAFQLLRDVAGEVLA